MSAKTTKKVSNISSKPAKRAAAKDHPKQQASRLTAAGKSSAKVASKGKGAAKGSSGHASTKPSIKPTGKPKGKQLKPEKAKHAPTGSKASSSKPAAKGTGKAPPKVAAKTSAKVAGKLSGKVPAKAQPSKPGSKSISKSAVVAKTKGIHRDRPPAEKKLSKEAEKRAREAEKKAQAKAREAEKKAQAKAREKEQKLAASAKKQEAERKRQDAERLKQAQELEKRREAEQKAKEAERQRILAEKETAREAAREVAKQAAEAEKQRKLQEKEATRVAKEQERAQQKAQRDAEREEVRRLKEEEKAKRDAEREAYRKAKETEREKIRAVKEAARRALEGRIAEATKNANKLGGGRSTSTRFYSPRAIPDQSGTTRRMQGPSFIGVAPSIVSHAAQPGGSDAPAPANHLPTPLPPVAPQVSEDAPLEPIAFETESVPPEHEPEVESEDVTSTAPASTEATTESVATPSTAPGSTPEGAPHGEEEAAHSTTDRTPSPTDNVEERYRAIEERLKHVPEAFRRDYQETIDMSWIHHDSALEGVVYTFQELKTAIDPGSAVVTDSSLQPVIDEIRRHKSAIELVRDLGERKRAPITVDTIKKIYITLHPEEGDVKTVKYRRDIPQHRLYFHEYAHPEKVPQKVRQVVDWLNGPEPKKLKSPIRVAARVHYELLRAFPFQTDSGKVARLVMNLILIRAGHPPALIHSTERQRYYEALKGALPVLVQMVTESIMNALASIEKLLDEQEAKLRS